ncbi:hypothetical protein AAVH_26735 [Aphelenchoides avenae]|nr:hypothetical protein AAVH_26735 [Aphelenchus avenae]
MLASNGTFVIFANGVVRQTDYPNLEMWLMIAFLSVGLLNVVTLPVPFLYRYLHVCRGTPARTSLLVKLCIIPTLVFIVGIAVSFNLFGYPPDGFRARAATVLRETVWPHETYFPAHMFSSELVSMRH